MLHTAASGGLFRRSASMTDIEQVVRAHRNEIFPAPTNSNEDWEDVLMRAEALHAESGRSHEHRRVRHGFRTRTALILASASAALAIALATPLGSALANSLHGLSDLFLSSRVDTTPAEGQRLVAH